MGCHDAANVRYTRDKRIAHILNEMLLFLLREHPADAKKALKRWLESSDGRERVCKDKKEHHEQQRQQPQTTQPQPLQTHTSYPYSRGSGLSALKLANNLLTITILETILTQPAPTPFPYVKGSGLLALHITKEKHHTYLSILSELDMSDVVPFVGACRGAYLYLLQEAGSSTAHVLVAGHGLDVLNKAHATPWGTALEGILTSPALTVVGTTVSRAGDGLALLAAVERRTSINTLYDLSREEPPYVGLRLLKGLGCGALYALAMQDAPYAGLVMLNVLAQPGHFALGMLQTLLDDTRPCTAVGSGLAALSEAKKTRSPSIAALSECLVRPPPLCGLVMLSEAWCTSATKALLAAVVVQNGPSCALEGLSLLTATLNGCLPGIALLTNA